MPSQCHKGLKCKNYDKEGPYDKKNMSFMFSLLSEITPIVLFPIRPKFY